MMGIPLPPVDEIEWIRLQEEIKHKEQEEDESK